MRVFVGLVRSRCFGCGQLYITTATRCDSQRSQTVSNMTNKSLGVHSFPAEPPEKQPCHHRVSWCHGKVFLHKFHSFFIIRNKGTKYHRHQLQHWHQSLRKTESFYPVICPAMQSLCSMIILYNMTFTVNIHILLTTILLQVLWPTKHLSSIRTRLNFLPNNISLHDKK